MGRKTEVPWSTRILVAVWPAVVVGILLIAGGTVLIHRVGRRAANGRSPR